MALAVGAGADRHRHGAVVVDLDGAVLGVQAERGGHLDVGGDADAELHRVAVARRRACSARSSS